MTPLTVCSGFNLPISLPFASVTVTVPSSATVIVASFGKFGFASLTAFSTAFFSSSSNLDGSFTSTGVAGALIVSLPGVCAVAFDVSVGVDVFPDLSVAFALTSVPS